MVKKIKKYLYSITRPGYRIEDLFENSIDGIYRSTLDGRYLKVNSALAEILGYENKGDLMKVNTKDLYFVPEDRPSSEERNRVFGTCLKKKDGSKIYVEISSRVIYSKGKPIYYEGIVRDRTEYKKYEEKIRYLSFHDALTSLYNRTYFDEELQRLNKTRVLPITVIIADVDRLKYVNDTFGHGTGDQLLKKVADIFRDNFRNEDMIARIGGDEFCIILPGTSKREALIIIQRIKIKCEFESSKRLPISISFGVSEKYKANMSIGQALRDAEKMMYHDKRKSHYNRDDACTGHGPKGIDYDI